MSICLIPGTCNTSNAVLSFYPPKETCPPWGSFWSRCPQMPPLICLGPPLKLFISGTLVCIEILIQMLKHILQTIIFLLYYTDEDCTLCTIQSLPNSLLYSQDSTESVRRLYNSEFGRDCIRIIVVKPIIIP